MLRAKHNFKNQLYSDLVIIHPMSISKLYFEQVWTFWPGNTWSVRYRVTVTRAGIKKIKHRNILLSEKQHIKIEDSKKWNNNISNIKIATGWRNYFSVGAPPSSAQCCPGSEPAITTPSIVEIASSQTEITGELGQLIGHQHSQHFYVLHPIASNV